MSRKQQRVFWPVLLTVLLSVGALAFASNRWVHHLGNDSSVAASVPLTLASAKDDDHVRIGRLWPQLRFNLKALGDRLQKPGKERLTLTATLSRTGEPQSVPVLLVLEFPDRVHLQMQGVGSPQVITFNGSAARKAGGRLDQREEDLLEILIYDTADHFFAGQNRGTATRFLGDHFHLDDGPEQNYTGPYYDVYQTTEEMKHTVPAREQTKLYCFNSETLLLERVRYQSQASPVEIQISGWQQIQGQHVPTRIVRLEGGQPVLTLTVSSVAIGPKIDDAIFDQ